MKAASVEKAKKYKAKEISRWAKDWFVTGLL